MKPNRWRNFALLSLAGFASVTWAQIPGHYNSITDVPGVTVGQTTSADSGATVVLIGGPNGGAGVPTGFVARGGSPGLRETDVLNTVNRNEFVNGVVLTGGSLYGLAATAGVMLCLEGKGLGVSSGGGIVPIVPTSASFDRATCGRPPATRPDLAAGQQACMTAATGAVAQGNVGGGNGAVSGGVKGGIGTASVVLPNGVIVGALVSVNSEGAAYDENGELHAASLGLDNEFEIAAGSSYISEIANFAGGTSRVPLNAAAGPLRTGTSAVVATNVQLTKAQATQVAQMADDGIARAITPAHTAGDGDAVFATGTARIPLSSLGGEAEVITMIGAAAANTVSRAIVHALLAATSTACQPSYCDAFPSACRNRR